MLCQNPSRIRKVQPISEFPKTYRDLSFSISEYQTCMN